MTNWFLTALSFEDELKTNKEIAEELDKLIIFFLKREKISKK